MSDALPSTGWATAAWVLVVVAYVGLSTVWVSNEPGWYAGLDKPSFQPPDAVFGIMWPLNFLALFIVGAWFTRSVEAGPAWRATAVLAVSVVAALAWAWLFYVPHRLTAAALCLVVAAVLTWLLVALVARSLPAAGVALAPYAVWMSVAAALSVGYSRLN